jgi:hypothetical protein
VHGPQVIRKVYTITYICDSNYRGTRILFTAMRLLFTVLACCATEVRVLLISFTESAAAESPHPAHLQVVADRPHLPSIPASALNT